MGGFEQKDSLPHAHSFSNGSEDSLHLRTCLKEYSVILLQTEWVSKQQSNTFQQYLLSVSIARRSFTFIFF